MRSFMGWALNYRWFKKKSQWISAIIGVNIWFSAAFYGNYDTKNIQRNHAGRKKNPSHKAWVINPPKKGGGDNLRLHNSQRLPLYGIFNARQGAQNAIFCSKPTNTEFFSMRVVFLWKYYKYINFIKILTKKSFKKFIETVAQMQHCFLFEQKFMVFLTFKCFFRIRYNA